jgi:hypothetical protein
MVPVTDRMGQYLNYYDLLFSIINSGECLMSISKHLQNESIALYWPATDVRLIP